MSLTVLTDASEIKAAFEFLKARTTKGTKPKDVTIGWQGGKVEGTISWRAREGIWSHFNSEEAADRYYCWYGVQDPWSPEAPGSLSIACEINPPKEGIKRNIGGAFLRGAGGQIFYAHLGNLGGGGKGIGKTAFFNWLGHERLTTITWPDGKSSEAVVLGAIRRPRFVRDLAAHVYATQRFKKDVKSGRSHGVVSTPGKPFSPEFAGKKRSYKTSDTIDSRCDHGYVVNSLSSALKSLKLIVRNDRERDLFIVSSKGTPTMLFEAKTSTDSQSIYTAVGQLMLHGVLDSPVPQRVLVVPERPKSKTAEILKRVNIDVLVFELDGAQARFPGLKELLKRSGVIR